MSHLKAISIKFLIIATIVFSTLGIFSGASLWNVLFISLLVTGIGYVVGDLFILPKLGNLIATIADFGLAFLSIWILSAMFFQAEFGLLPTTLFASILISCSESVFHIYMNNKLPNDHDEIYIRNRSNNLNVQTEFGEENPDQDYIKRRNKE